MADQTFNVLSGFYTSVDGDRLYSADDMMRPYHRIVTNGVFALADGTPSTDLKVTHVSGLTIQVAAGEGLFADRWFESPSMLQITVPINSGRTTRIDSVIVSIDTRLSGRVGSVVYRTGKEVEPPINERDDVYEYRVANVTVPAGAGAISEANITDLRGSSECPWVTSPVNQLHNWTRVVEMLPATWEGQTSYTFTVSGLTDSDIVIVDGPDALYTDYDFAVTQIGSQITFAVSSVPSETYEVRLGIVKALAQS